MSMHAARVRGEQPQEKRFSTDDGSIALFEWRGAEPTVFFAHATGFHARCWDEVIRRLPGIRCIAMDVLGHGNSDSPPPTLPYGWQRLAHGATEVIRGLGLQSAIGVGHSMGGYLVVRAAAALPNAFAQLLLVDPSILAPDAYGRVLSSGAANFVLRRRSIWSSPEEMIERFTGRPPFGDWQAQVLDDYCRGGLLLAEDGSFKLACSPEVEAAIYSATAGDSPYADIARLAIPVRVLRARQRPAEGPVDMSHSPTAPDLARHFARGEDVPLPDHSHYIPMEDPDVVATHVKDLAARLAKE